MIKRCDITYVYILFYKSCSIKGQKIINIEVKYSNLSSKKAKFTTVDVRKLSLIPNINNIVLINTFQLLGIEIYVFLHVYLNYLYYIVLCLITQDDLQKAA